jgi:hypothetical protein
VRLKNGEKRMNLQTARQILDQQQTERHSIARSESNKNDWQVWWDGIKLADGLASKESAKDWAAQMDIEFAKNLIIPAEQRRS